MAKRRPQNDQRRSGRFVGLPHEVLASPAWATLSLTGRAVMIEMVRRHNGYNNGEIGAGQRELADALNTTNLRAIGAACAELVTHGFLAVEREARRWNREARQYRVTWLPTGEPPHQRRPGDEWKAFSSDDASSSKNGVRDDASSSKRPTFDDASSSRILESRRKRRATPPEIDDASSSLIGEPYPLGGAPSGRADDDALRGAIVAYTGGPGSGPADRWQRVARLAARAGIDPTQLDDFTTDERGFDGEPVEIAPPARAALLEALADANRP